MGSGGSSGPFWGLMVSGQNGGRIIPGTHYGLTTAGTGVTQAWLNNDGVATNTIFDYRPTKRFGLSSTSGAPGGGTNQPGFPGFDAGYAQNSFTEPAGGLLASFSSGTITALRSIAGSGGGWGAKGGDHYRTPPTGGSPGPGDITVGGAGGKAVNTNGFSVTWLGGQDRAYGVVG
jgi:hypothetical protein